MRPRPVAERSIIVVALVCFALMLARQGCAAQPPGTRENAPQRSS